MDIKDLRYFLAVYEAQSFARAGVLLNTVQSNVSAHIKRLELEFGARLFDRQWHGIAATAQGELLYGYAKRVIALVDEIEEAVARNKEPARLPRVSTRRHGRPDNEWPFTEFRKTLPGS